MVERDSVEVVEAVSSENPWDANQRVDGAERDGAHGGALIVAPPPGSVIPVAQTGARLREVVAEVSEILDRRLAVLGANFDADVNAFATRMQALADALGEARADALRYAHELERVQHETGVERVRHKREVAELTEQLTRAERESTRLRDRERDMDVRLALLGQEVQNRVVALETLEARFREEVEVRERQLTEMSKLNEEYESKVSAVLEFKRKLDQCLT